VMITAAAYYLYKREAVPAPDARNCGV